MRKHLLLLIIFSVLFRLNVSSIQAQIRTPSPTPVEDSEATDEASIEPSPSPIVVEARVDITQRTEEVVSPLEALLRAQNPGPILTSPIKHMIRSSIAAGVPVNTLVLLLLLPVVVAFIAAARHLVGLRGFGIFLPAALAIVFLALGPIVGLALFLAIIITSSLGRIVLRKIHLRLHYLPRVALILTLVVFAAMTLIYAGSYIARIPGVSNISIFPVLILVLLSDDVSRVQMGKSLRTAINLTAETLILALVSYIFLTMEGLQRFALLNPEYLLIAVAVFDIVLGKFSGLRFLEYWRFRKLINNRK